MSLSTTLEFSSVSSPNVQPILPNKLDDSNYLFWKSQFIPLLKGYNLYDHVANPSSFPPQILSPEDQISSTENPAYTLRYHKDEQLLSWLMSSLTVPVHGHVVGLTSAHDVCTSLERTYSNQSGIRVLRLKQ